MASSIQNLDKLQAKLANMPPRSKELMKQANDRSADAFLKRFQAVAPVDPNSPDPGALRNSAVKENGRSDVAVRVVVGGDAFPAVAHVEWGHKTPAGKHVRAEPSVFPTARSLKRSALTRAATALRKAAKEGVLTS